MCWQPITSKILTEWGWDAPTVRLKDDTHEEIGSWGFEDENYDGDYWFAWHKEDEITPLGFAPTHFAPLKE